MSEALDVVTRFFDLLAAGRADTAVTLLDEHVEWRNSSAPTLRGRRVAAALRLIERLGLRFTADLHHALGEGEVVLIERTDHLHYRRWEATFWVYGTFVVREGRIVLWQDRFSVGNVLLGSLRGLLRMLRPRAAS